LYITSTSAASDLFKQPIFLYFSSTKVTFWNCGSQTVNRSDFTTSHLTNSIRSKLKVCLFFAKDP